MEKNGMIVFKLRKGNQAFFTKDSKMLTLYLGMYRAYSKRTISYFHIVNFFKFFHIVFTKDLNCLKILTSIHKNTSKEKRNISLTHSTTKTQTYEYSFF